MVVMLLERGPVAMPVESMDSTGRGDLCTHLNGRPASGDGHYNPRASTFFGVSLEYRLRRQGPSSISLMVIKNGAQSPRGACCADTGPLGYLAAVFIIPSMGAFHDLGWSTAMARLQDKSFKVFFF